MHISIPPDSSSHIVGPSFWTQLDHSSIVWPHPNSLDSHRSDPTTSKLPKWVSALRQGWASIVPRPSHASCVDLPPVHARWRCIPRHSCKYLDATFLIGMSLWEAYLGNPLGRRGGPWRSRPRRECRRAPLLGFPNHGHCFRRWGPRRRDRWDSLPALIRGIIGPKWCDERWLEI